MPGTFRWLRSGEEALAAMLAAIADAGVSIRLETYIFQGRGIGDTFRTALVDAARRGVRVQLMVDAIGSIYLPADYWKPLTEVGGAFKLFNPLSLRRLSYRNHRKLLVCDDRLAFIGGFNLADAYNGDGVAQGWRDLGLGITGSLVPELARTFDEIFAPLPARRRRLQMLNMAKTRLDAAGDRWRLLLSGPGRGGRRLRTVLRQDILRSRNVKIICAYFLPTWRLRKALAHVCNHGGNVELLLAGKTDVLISQLASRRLYRTLLRSGVKIYEYQPQILHAKLFILDDIVCVGSANLDTRSLIINHELLVRIEDAKLADEAREIFAHDLAYSRRIEREAWRSSRTLPVRALEWLAYFVLVHVDPYLARLQLRLFRTPRQSGQTPSRASAASSAR